MTELQRQQDVGFVKGLPRHNKLVRQFTVKDELLLVSTGSGVGLPPTEPRQSALAVSHTGRAIWDLCDGANSPENIARILEPQYDIDFPLLCNHVGQALISLSRLGFIDGLIEHERALIPTVLAIGIEDHAYFRWQTAILLESLHGKLPVGWKAHVVVCNDGADLSNELRTILDVYQTSHSLSTNHSQSHRIDVGHNGGQFYPAMNKVEALAVVAQTVLPSDMIFLLDSDMFLFGNLPFDIFPSVCAMPKNWHVGHEPFFASVAKNGGKGMDLKKLLETMGCDSPFLPGGVNIFVTGTVAQNPKFIADCFRFAHALYLLGRAAGAESTWIAEMPCFALAMTANGVSYEILDNKQFLVSDCNEDSIPDGTFYHYFSDPKDDNRAAFKDSNWCKQAYASEDFLRTDFDPYLAQASTAHEKYFFNLAARARSRLNV